MNFVDIIILLVLILILIAISVNMFIAGRDLTTFPTRKQNERHIRDQYPGSLDDDYESGYESPNPSKIASYVSNQIN